MRPFVVGQQLTVHQRVGVVWEDMEVLVPESGSGFRVSFMLRTSESRMLNITADTCPNAGRRDYRLLHGPPSLAVGTDQPSPPRQNQGDADRAYHSQGIWSLEAW